jgi:hypothetical protein
VTDIYIVTCVFKIPQTQLQLQFVSEAAAREAFAKLNEMPKFIPRPSVDWTMEDIARERDIRLAFVIDSYGAEAVVDRSQLAAVIFEFVNRKLDAQQEIQLLRSAAPGNGVVMPRQ